jgi:hypothetical protein
VVVVNPFARKSDPERDALVAYFGGRLSHVARVVAEYGPMGKDKMNKKAMRLASDVAVSLLRDLSDLGAEEEAFGFVASHPVAARRLVQEWARINRLPY